MLHINQTWAAARYHAEAKNVAKAAEFGNEAFRILELARQDPELSSLLRRRAHASAYRVDARYLLDGGLSARALAAWFRALFTHPPTALARLNIFVSCLLDLSGLNKLRQQILLARRKRHSNK